MRKTTAPKPRRLALLLGAAQTHALDIVAVAGGGSIVVGVAQIYSPAAWIAAGVMLLAGVRLYVRPDAEPADDEAGD
jgi:hypothetical protein